MKRNSHKMRWITTALIVLVTVLAIFYLWRPRPIPVDMETIDRGPLEVVIEEEGRTRIRDLFVLSAPVAGQLMRINVEAGDSVSAEETILATIRPAAPAILDQRAREQAEADVDAAVSAAALARSLVAKAEAEVRFARSERNRIAVLQDKGTVSPRSLEQAEMELSVKQAVLRTARADLEVRRHQLARARAMLLPTEASARQSDEDCCLQITAPGNGKVLRILHKSQGVVAAGEPLLELGDPRDQEIVTDLLSADAVRVSTGDRVYIDRWGGAQQLRGFVRRVEPVGFTKVSALGVEEQRVNVIIDLENGDFPAALGHGFKVNSRIIIWQSEDSLRVPLGALFRLGKDWHVFRLVEGRARLSPVKLGQMGENHGQVLAGLDAGDTVILQPGNKIVDGILIEPRPQAVAEAN